MKRPRGTCPVCGRSIAGRLVNGKVVLRSHMKVLGGTKESGWGPSVPCSGTGQSVALETAPREDHGG